MRRLDHSLRTPSTTRSQQLAPRPTTVPKNTRNPKAIRATLQNHDMRKGVIIHLGDTMTTNTTLLHKVLAVLPSKKLLGMDPSIKQLPLHNLPRSRTRALILDISLVLTRNPRQHIVTNLLIKLRLRGRRVAMSQAHVGARRALTPATPLGRRITRSFSGSAEYSVPCGRMLQVTTRIKTPLSEARSSIAGKSIRKCGVLL